MGDEKKNAPSVRRRLPGRALRELERPPSGSKQPYKYWDASVPAFGLFVFASGRMTWNLAYRVNGKLFTKMLGRYPNVTRADAKKRAQRILNAASDGRNTAAEMRAKSKKPRFGAVALEYLEKYAKPNKRSWREDERLIHKELMPAWKRKLAHEINRKDVLDVLDGIVERGAAIQANRVKALISKIFNWAIGRDLVEVNPCAQVKKPAKENQRDRVLEEEEIRALWQAFGKQSLLIGNMFKLRLLTAQRGGEIESMAWKDLELEKGVWTIPGEIAKNGLSHRVPLSPTAQMLLKELEGVSGGREWVFPSPKANSGHISNVQKAANRVRGLSGVDNFVLHDLRRTAATFMTRAKIPRLIVGKILNHVDAGVTAVYDRNPYEEEKRDALEKWESLLLKILPKPKQQVMDPPMTDDVFKGLDMVRKSQGAPK